MLESRTTATPAAVRRAAIAAAAFLAALAGAARPTAALAQCPNQNRLYVHDGGSPAAPIGFLNRLDNTYQGVSTPLPFGDGGISVNRSLTKAYVAGRSTGQLIEVDLTTGLATTITSGLNGPYGVVLNAAETDAWVTNETTGQLVSVNLATGMLYGVASGLSMPQGFAVDSTESFAYVAESGSGRVARVDLGSGTVLPGGGSGIAAPLDVAINATDSMLYVTDRTAGTLYKVSPSGGVATVVATGLANPSGVAVDAAETLAFVVESNGQLTEVTLPTGMKNVLYGGLGIPSGLTLASSPCQNATLSPSNPKPATGSRVAICLHIDMRNSSETLGSYGVALGWDPNVLHYVTAIGGDAPFDTPIINGTNAASGTFSAADADPTGAAGAPHLLCTEFDVVGPTGSSTTIHPTLTSISGAGTFNDLSATAVANDLDLDVQGLCIVGDVNGSTGVNSGDALIILSHEILLPIPAQAQTFIDAGCGDADGDTFTDSVDADIVLTSEVGLPIDPNFPVDAPIVTFDSCPSCSAPPALLQASPLEFLTAAATGAPEVPVTLSFTNSKPKKGDLFEVVVGVDMGPSGMRLGSYAAHFTWPVEVAEYLGAVRGAAPAFARPMVNAREASSGVVRFAQADPAGAEGALELVRLQFRAKHALPHLERTFAVAFSSMGAPGPGFHKLSPVDATQRKARALSAQ